MKPQLVYFDIRGRAEPIRLLLAHMEVEYEDFQVTLESWPEIKPNTPFGRMPVYRDGEIEIPETFAILNHLGRKFDLQGATEESRIRCDVTIEAFRDYGNRVASIFGALGSPSDETRAAFIEVEMPERLSKLNSYYVDRPGHHDCWAVDSLTIADVAAFHSIEGVANRFPETLSMFEGLTSFHAWFGALPRIGDYLRSARRPAAMFYGPNGKIYPR